MTGGHDAFFLAVALGAALCSPAHGMCRLTFVDGMHRQLYDHERDDPVIESSGIAPILPPSIPSIMPRGIPPPGTSSSTELQVWDGTAYVWHPMCE